MAKRGLARRGMELVYERRVIFGAVGLLILGVLMPLVFNEGSFGIYRSLVATLSTANPEGLLLAATKLVFLNTIRALPHYLGAFIINDAVTFSLAGRRRFTFNVMVTFFIIWFIYQIIDWIYPIRYDFGPPAILIVILVLWLSYINLFSVSWLNKGLLLFTLLFSIQWLDVLPGLTPYGFGKGEISWDVKMTAGFMGYSGLLTLFVVLIFVAFVACSVIQIQLLYKEHKLKVTNTKNRQVEKELHNTQMQALSMRSFGEVQSLVHDLKTPLTTIQGLVTLSEMMEEDEQIREYLEKISHSVTSMSSMISEILYEEKQSTFTTEDMMRVVLSQVSIQVPDEMLRYTNECREAKITGNRIRLARAIINTIDNAYQAVDKESGVIHLRVWAVQGIITIEVSDNGRGISEQRLAQVWELGYSGSDSTGLGLGFVRQVIEYHGGTVNIESRENAYTRVTMQLKEAKGA